MQLKDWIPALGWVVTFALGILSGGLIVPRLTHKRTILKWALVNESEIVPRELSRLLGLPVSLSVGTASPASLSVVTLRIGSGGEEVIKDLECVVGFNPGASILNVRPSDDLGEYKRQLRWTVEQNKCRVSAGFLNPRQAFQLEFVVSEYEQGSTDLDAAAPGLELRRQDPNKWDVPKTSFLRGVGLSMIGVRYDPAAISMSEIAEELRAVRRHLTRAVPSGETEGDATHLYRLAQSESQLRMVRYLHGVDDDWVPLSVLADHAGTDPGSAKKFLDGLCNVDLASARTESGNPEYKLSYKVG
jgi:hypothetical protein